MTFPRLWACIVLALCSRADSTGPKKTVLRVLGILRPNGEKWRLSPWKWRGVGLCAAADHRHRPGGSAAAQSHGARSRNLQWWRAYRLFRHKKGENWGVDFAEEVDICDWHFQQFDRTSNCGVPSLRTAACPAIRARRRRQQVHAQLRPHAGLDTPCMNGVSGCGAGEHQSRPSAPVAFVVGWSDKGSNPEISGTSPAGSGPAGLQRHHRRPH